MLRTDPVAIVLFLVGLMFGFATALAGPFDLTANWLIVAYVLVVGIFIEGIFITIPRQVDERVWHCHDPLTDCWQRMAGIPITLAPAR